jgi:hypothetical protein
MKKEVYGIYQEESDITFIMEATFDENNDVKSLEVKGFYHGEPNKKANEDFYNDLIAYYD